MFLYIAINHSFTHTIPINWFYYFRRALLALGWVRDDDDNDDDNDDGDENVEGLWNDKTAEGINLLVAVAGDLLLYEYLFPTAPYGSNTILLG